MHVLCFTRKTTWFLHSACPVGSSFSINSALQVCYAIRFCLALRVSDGALILAYVRVFLKFLCNTNLHLLCLEVTSSEKEVGDPNQQFNSQYTS